MHKILIGFSALALLAVPACGGGDGGDDDGMGMADAGGDNPDGSSGSIDGSVQQECLPETIAPSGTVGLMGPLPLEGTAPERQSGGLVLSPSPMEDPVDGLFMQFVEGAGVFSEGFGTVTDGQISTDPQSCGACLRGFVNAPNTPQGVNVQMAELLYGVESGTLQIDNYQDPTAEMDGNIAGSIEDLVLAPLEGDCANTTVNFDFNFDLSVASAAAREVNAQGPVLKATQIAN